ncbi:MAG: tetratricopeptide repeat protein [Lachnospiraceae bacterium]|nr:tetratricopeptide repeat protein [Lachnospiraceae bacterium]
MYQSGMNQTKRGFVAVALLFAVMLFAAGCGKADQAYDQAMKLAEEGKYQKAAESFEKAIEANGEKAEYYIGYGMTLNHLGDYKKAVKQFEKAYQEMDNKISRKNNKQLYYGEALAYYGMYQYDKALERCQDALDVEGQPEIDSNVYATMAVVQWASGNSEEAVASLDKLLEDDKKDVNGYLQRGQLYLHMGEPETALQDFSQALQLDKDCYDAYFGMYDAYMASGQVDAARESLEMLTGIRAKSAEQKMQVGRAYQVLEEEEQAIRYLEDAQKDKCVEAEYYLGMVQMAKQDYDTAIGYFESYIKDAAAVQIPEVYNQLAGALIETKEYDRAEEYLEEGLALGMSSAYQSLSRNQVILLEKQQKYSKAKKAANAYLKAYPADEAMIKELEFIKTRIRTADTKQEESGDSKTQDGQPAATSDPAGSGQPSPTPEQTADSQSSPTPGSTGQGKAKTDSTAASPNPTTEDPSSTETSQDSDSQSPADQAQGSRYSVQ